MFVPSVPAAYDDGRTSSSASVGMAPHALETLRLQVTIPFASVVYSSTGVHIAYTMQIRDDTHDIEWQATSRYSAFRQLHQTVGKHVVRSDAKFPSMMITSKANRDKKEIELRRRRLEVYMGALVASLFSDQRSHNVHLRFLIKTLGFLDYPYLDECVGGLGGRGDGDCLSSTSDATVAGGERISVLEQDTDRTIAMPPPSIVTTRWRSPPVLPGVRLGLCLPYVSLAQAITGTWDVVVRADRSTRKGFLRHRYDEAVAMCAHTAALPQVMDAGAAQQFIVEFRKLHPLTAYLTYEKALVCTTPTSASRVDRSSTGQLSPSVGDTTPQHSDDDEDVVGSPIVHHHRESVGPIAEEAEVAARRLFPSLRKLDGIEDALQLGLHYTLCDSMRLPRTPQGGLREYVEAVRGPRVDGCRCTTSTFCSSNHGDVYTTQSGFAILVCPPKTDDTDE